MIIYLPFDSTTTLFSIKLEFLFDVNPSNKQIKWKIPSLINIMIQKYIYFRSLLENHVYNIQLQLKFCLVLQMVLSFILSTVYEHFQLHVILWLRRENNDVKPCAISFMLSPMVSWFLINKCRLWIYNKLNEMLYKLQQKTNWDFLLWIYDLFFTYKVD